MKYIKNFVVNPILLFFCTGIFGQTGQLVYDSILDSLWSENTYINQMSPDGFWVTFTEFFPFQENKLHLAHTKSSDFYTFEEGYKQVFSSNNEWFSRLSIDGNFTLFNLRTRHQKQTENVMGFDFSTSGNYLGIIKRNGNSASELVIDDLEKSEQYPIQFVESFLWDSNDKILCVQTIGLGEQLILFDPKLKEEKVLKTFPTGKISNLSYHNSLNSYVFLLQEKGGKSIIVISETGKIRQLTHNSLKQQFGNSVFSDRGFSIEGDMIFFYREQPKENKAKSSSMEIWNTTDAWEYPRMVQYKNEFESKLLTGWDVKRNKLFEITTQSKPSLKFSGKRGCSIIFNEFANEPEFKEYPYVDLYLRKYDSGTESLVIKNLYNHPYNFSVSSNGEDIVFFKEKDWFWYSLSTHRTLNLTNTIGNEFVEKEIPNFTGLAPKSPAFWSSDGNLVYLTDQNDIWKFNLSNGNKHRITKGAENGLRYKINKEIFRNDNQGTLNDGNHLYDESIILEVRDNQFMTGYVKYFKGDLENLVMQNGQINEILGNKNYSSIVFKTQRYNHPPAIYVLDTEHGITHLLYQSNKGLLNYDFGHSINITYKNNKGEPLNGSLFYPAEFDPAKSYPLIVNVYERKSRDINRFIPPGDFEMTGFSLLKYLTNGYFILYPDISYEFENPGLSALDCVTSAVNAACTLVSEIDKEKKGLYGHSFGGYEAVFIPTQTDFFQAVAAGAAPTNFISWYHSMGWLWDKSEIWRFESGQFRMGKSFYEIPESYLKNSPLQHVENLKTPLLLWTGKQDFQVNWTQSVEMFLAMRRLKKQGRLLLFNGEDHTLSQKENQFMLSKELYNWFEKYLK